MKSPLIPCLLTLACGAAFAALPPLNDAAKAKAAEAAARAAWNSKVDTYQLCKSQDMVAARYHQAAMAAGKASMPATTVPACAEPGAFAYVPAEKAKPIEAAGAHSPAATATSPPSTTQPDAVVNPAKKL